MATTSALARTTFVRTHYVRTNNIILTHSHHTLNEEVCVVLLHPRDQSVGGVHHVKFRVQPQPVRHNVMNDTEQKILRKRIQRKIAKPLPH